MENWKVIDANNKEIKNSQFRNYGGHLRKKYDSSVNWIVINNKWISICSKCLLINHENKTITFDKEKNNN